MDGVISELSQIAAQNRWGLDIIHWMWKLKEKHMDSYLHCHRVALLGKVLGEALGMNQHDVEEISIGCYLHDIGKLMIPNHILDVSRELSPMEWKLVKFHPQVGVEMIGKSGLIPEGIISIIQHHHERWDGRGYPAGLAKEEIPFGARICAVVDAFDSMVMPRPYHAKLTFQEAFLELQEHAGSQFCPEVVACFHQEAEVTGSLYTQMKHLA